MTNNRIFCIFILHGDSMMRLVEITLPDYIPGRLYASSMPFSTTYDPDGQLLKEYVNKSIQHVIVLSSIREIAEKSARDLLLEYQTAYMNMYYLPIEDFSVPDKTLTEECIKKIVALLTDGYSIVVHCHAGQGRTGTIMALIMKKIFGLSGENALTKIRAIIPGAVETREQEEFVLSF